ncbi:MAG: hypothetical protein RL026_373 [Pseudomonadota bacterium]
MRTLNTRPQIAVNLLNLPRQRKRLVMLLLDALLLPLSLFGAFALKWDDGTVGFDRHPALYVAVTLTVLFTGSLVGLYRAAVRYLDMRALMAIVVGVGASAVVLYALGHGLGAQPVRLSTTVIYALVASLALLGTRLLARWFLSTYSEQREPVIIFGAGEAGADLAVALLAGRHYQPVAYVDEKRALIDTQVRGLPVIPPEEIAAAIRTEGVRTVLMAIPGAARSRRSAIIRDLEALGVRVQTVPDLEDIAAGRARLNELRDIDAADLLGRDMVPPNQRLLDACIRGKNVLVTGGGGSIGSELCRQILKLAPRRLCVFEMSEHGLYQIERELRAAALASGSSTEIVALLGSAHHRARMREVMRAFGINTVYHAAAYKHVPIVEHNMIEGIHNNLISTWYTAEAALESGVETFVLISTDKAVNPTNVMGATKRLAEMVLQGLQRRGGGRTRFCMVRFGNVLESSGSVVPLFRDQIRRGGPVTVTHPEMVRYFMVIPEAAQLVIQAGSMGQGGDVFVLDMGQPVRIQDLARRMIQLSGLTVKDERNPEGDIEIAFTGLRPAEKLYEELLIGKNVTGTDHPMIMRAVEHSLSWAEMDKILQRLMVILDRFDCEAASSLLQEAVVEYHSADGVQDLVWQRQRDGVAAVALLPVKQRQGQSLTS